MGSFAVDFFSSKEGKDRPGRRARLKDRRKFAAVQLILISAFGDETEIICAERGETARFSFPLLDRKRILHARDEAED